MSLAAQVLTAARDRNETIVIAESCTGGLLTSALTEMPGASLIIETGIVAYSYASKTTLLGVKPESLFKDGAVSADVAHQMALGALKASNATLAIAITGVAGPQDSERKPAGTVWFCTASATESATELKEFGALGRDNVRNASVEHALVMLLNVLTLPNN